MVNNRLSDADKLQPLPHSGAKAITAAAGGVGESNHPDPSIGGIFNGTVIVSLAMLVFFLIVAWKGGVRAITRGLDGQIAAIRTQLDEARALRGEAEALRDEYARKMTDAEGNAREMIAHAEAESEGLVAQAKLDAADLVDRRARMASDKIAAAERQALADVRARAAAAATRAATAIIAARVDAGADKALVDRTIAGLGRLN